VVSIVPWVWTPWVVRQLWRSADGDEWHGRFYAHVAAINYL